MAKESENKKKQKGVKSPKLKNEIDKPETSTITYEYV